MNRIFLFLLLYLLFPLPVPANAPPFDSSLDIGEEDGLIITDSDPSVSFEVVYGGTDERSVYDWRVSGWMTFNMFIFTTTYADGSSVEYQVPVDEFGSKSASNSEVSFYALVMGRLPQVLRSGVNVITLFKDNSTWNGPCGGINIYTDRTPTFMETDAGLLEEVLVHEGGHGAFDCLYGDTEKWQAAQEADNAFISVFAGSKPVSEDLTESFLAFLALSRCDRVGEEACAVIRQTIPARIAFFDEHLKVEFGFPINAGLSGAWYEPETAGQGVFFEVLPETKQIFLGWYTYDTERPSASAPSNLGEPGHRWITALGPYEGGIATLNVYQTKGGVFDAEFPAPITDMEGDGTIRLEFESCISAVMHYDITSIGRSGSVPLQRIAHDNVPLCEALTTVED